MLVRLRRRRLAPALLVLAAALTVPAAPGAAAPKVRCKPGQVPVIAGTASKPKLTLKKGKAQCKPQPKLKASQAERAAGTPQGAVASTADAILQALAINPAVLKKAERKLGKKATSALVTRTLGDWRSGASAQARRFAEEGFHYSGTFGDAAKGTAGSAKLDAGPAAGDGTGVKATATIEFSADAKGLKSLGADQITSGKSAKVRLDVSFEDAPTACPSAAGRVDGKLNASAKLTLTIDGQATTMSAKIEAKYFLSVGADARWKTIDGVDVWTTFGYSAPGEGTSTWRGNRSGAGFTDQGIFGDKAPKSFDDAIKEQRSHVRDDLGGVWGPKGRVLYSDPSTDNIFNYGGSISHLKGMVLTEIATQYLMFAAVEYIRHVVGPRGDKHWHDAEACLRLEGAPDKSRLGPGETAKVTVKNARAADGAAVATGQSATGVASLVPGSASVPAGGQFEYTLTAPTSTPVNASWQVVALSPAGKKTVSGNLAEETAFTVTLDSLETGDFATHLVTAKLTGTLKTTPVAQRPAESSASGPVTWTPLTAISHLGHEYMSSTLKNPVGGGTWTVIVTRKENDTLRVQILFSEDTLVMYTIVNDPLPEPCGSGICDEPPIEQPIQGPTPIALGLIGDFELPSAGGTKALKNSVLDAGDGLTSDATVTVTPGS